MKTKTKPKLLRRSVLPKRKERNVIMTDQEERRLLEANNQLAASVYGAPVI